MGKLLPILTIAWLVVITIGAIETFYWIGVMDDINAEPFSRPPGERFMTPEEFDARNEADRMIGAWGAGGFTFGYFGFNFLFVLGMKERRKDKQVKNRSHGQWDDIGQEKSFDISWSKSM